MKKVLKKSREEMLAGIRPAWMEVNLDRLEYNAEKFKEYIGDRTKLMAVIKSDAYSHGAVDSAKAFLRAGAEYLGVATLTEARELRKNHIKAPILVFGYIPLNQMEQAVKEDITVTVYMLEQVKYISNYAKKLNKDAKIHLKIDTGMSRLGFIPSAKALEEIIEISKMDNIIIEGIFSHFAESEAEDKSFTERQYEEFMGFVEKVEESLGRLPIRHISNAAAAINYPEYNLDMVRIGIPLFGVYPTGNVKKENIELKLTYEIKAQVGFVKEVKKGTSISYNRLWTADKDMKVATIPIGYGDGYSQEMGEKMPVRYMDRKTRVLGKVCMDQLMVDGDLLGDVSVGDEVTLVAKEDRDLIVTRDMANISKRLPRVYYKNGEIHKIVEYL